MRFKKLAIAALGGAVLVVGGAVLSARLGSSKPAANVEGAPDKSVWNSLVCRARLYMQHASGEAPELGWRELWELTRPGRGFYCVEGRSVAGSFWYSSVATDDDRAAGALTFRERCSLCHGMDGAGSPSAPSLTRSEYNHGDSDLAVYEVLKHGIPGTAMRSAELPTLSLLQLTAYLKSLQAVSSEDPKPEKPRLAIQVSDDRLRAAGSNPDEWLMYSGSYNGWRHTSLAEITPPHVSQTSMRWVKQFDISNSSIEATPLVIDGVIFMVPDVGHVVALEAKTGAVIWEYKQNVPRNLPIPDFGPVNRGLAALGSTLFLGKLDGYLVALNANNGKVVWQTLVASPADNFTINGAPLVVNHSVVVGVSGGEFGVRGFLAAYDVSTGQQQWRFNTIPGPGEAGHETWENDAWKWGGGGTWITGSYDPSTDLLYWGVGNPSPVFSGDGRPGDNLFTDSVIALHASTGSLAWHFQFTPHDEQDRDAAQTPVLADLPIKGEVRKAICWPNRNGFYYVLDRLTGEFLAGAPFVELNWAKGLTSTGRPILSESVDASTEERLIKPGISGGTNWQNPAFDPIRKTIFIPANESRSLFTKLPANSVIRGEHGAVYGSGMSQDNPDIHKVIALDAATGTQKWQYQAPDETGLAGGQGGLLSTAGGLVFGSSGGVLFALDAETGHEVWRRSLGGNTKSPPISFTVDGRQVVLVAAGRALFAFGM
jgi:alcohol dehydrogenase (cytochrome c)